jgi:hypothetical protein
VGWDGASVIRSELEVVRSELEVVRIELNWIELKWVTHLVESKHFLFLLPY